MKRKLLIGLGVVAGLVLVPVLGLVGFVAVKGDPTFDLPPTGLVASTDPALIAEGDYLFHGPMHCTACHDSSKEAAFARKPKERVDPIGGMYWDMGPMARPVSANLTSDKKTGIGAKSDEHVARVIKYGVGEDGKLRVFMALATASVTDREVVALLSYLRTLPPIEHEVEEEEMRPLGRMLLAIGAFKPKFLPPATYVAAPAEPTVARGEYLATGPALCAGCHSPYDFMNEMKLEGDLFSGCFAPEPGHEDPTIEVCPPNLTAHETAGHIAKWTEDAFVDRFRSGAFATRDTSMPWMNFTHLTDTDVRSIYRYLRSLPPSPRNVGPPVRAIGSFAPPAP